MNKENKIKYIKIGRIIKQTRKANGYSKSTLAQLANVSKSQINKIEKGKIDFYISTFEKICKALNLSVINALKVGL